MKTFAEYLYNMGYASATIRQYGDSFEIFNKWLSRNNIPAKEFDYKNLLEFIDQSMLLLGSRINPRSSLNRLLVSVSHYYDFLRIDDPAIMNPVKTVRVKNREEKLVHDLIHETDLRDLYEQIEPSSPRLVRNKVILGFLIFQGVTAGELDRLSIQNLKLRKGNIFIRGESGTNFRKGSTGRELPLAALQIIDIIDYLENVRPRILAGSYHKTPGRRPDTSKIAGRTDQLLFSMGGSENLKNSLLHLFRNLKQSNPQIKNATHIRQSVIASWLKKYDLRRVQYMAGHRYVSSTEFYKQVNLDLLKRKVIEFHPLK